MALNFIPAEGTKLMTGFRAKEVFFGRRNRRTKEEKIKSREINE